MPIPISLGDIRSAIRKCRRMTFTYEKSRIIADFYLLGQARKTGAYVIIAWCVEPVQEWRLLRYSLIRDLEAVGQIETLRSDFNPHHPKLGSVDTLAFQVRHQSH